MKPWRWVALGVAVAALWTLRHAMGTLFALMLLSATIAYVASPVAGFLERKVSRKWGAGMAFAMILLIVAAWLTTFVPMLVRQAIAVGEQLPVLWERGGAWLESIRDDWLAMGVPEDLMDSIVEQVGKVGVTLLESLREAMVSAVQWVSSIGWVALAPVVAYYLLRDRKSIFSYIERWLPHKERALVVSIATGSREAIGQYVRGQVIVSIITGVITAIGLLFVGLPSWLLMGFFMMIFNLIPYFGPVIGAIPIVLLATAQGWGMVAKCLVVVFAAQQIEAMFITPHILSNTANLHPVIVVVALFIGGSVMGLAGMVFVIPVVLILRVVMGKLIDYRLRTAQGSGRADVVEEEDDERAPDDP
jgi:predicted PurR-regulated permease PerM